MFIIVNATPARLEAIVLIGPARPQELRAWHLIAAVQIENRVKDRVSIVQLNDGVVREHSVHAGGENLPFLRSMEVIHHEKATSIDIITQLLALFAGKLPMADFNGVE